jgi:predicted dehydrogenase
VTELRGTGGTISIEFARWEACTVSIYDPGARQWSREEIATERDFMFRSEDEEFLRAVAEGTAVTCPLPEALKSQRILEQAQRQ